MTTLETLLAQMSDENIVAGHEPELTLLVTGRTDDGSELRVTVTNCSKIVDVDLKGNEAIVAQVTTV